MSHLIHQREAPEAKREELLTDLYRASAVAVRSNQCLVTTPHGRCLMTSDTRMGSLLCEYLPHGEMIAWRFSVRLADVQDLSPALKGLARVDFDYLMEHER